MALPGWDSALSVTDIHAALEKTALVFFAALVVSDVLAHLSELRHKLFERIGLICFGIAILAEICAYPYSRRKDELSAKESTAAGKEIGRLRGVAKGFEAQIASAQERTAGIEKANLKLRKDLKVAVATLAVEQRKTAEAQKAAAVAQSEVNKFITKETIIGRKPNSTAFEALKSRLPSKVDVFFKTNDGEAYMLATLVVKGLKELHWDVSGPIPTEASPFPTEPGPHGIWSPAGAPFIGAAVTTPRDITQVWMGPFEKQPTGVLLLGLVGGTLILFDSALPENTYRIAIGERPHW